MPSPFPGMDPYLESARFFPDLHSGLIFAMKDDLQGKLSQAYYAQSGQRVWLDDPIEAKVTRDHRAALAGRPTGAA
jgi:Protein of unknown function (DUF4058)